MEAVRPVGVEELLELVEKPVFAVDLQAIPPTPVYFNPHLRSIGSLEQSILRLWTPAELSHTLEHGILSPLALRWCTGLGREVDRVANAITFEGFQWVSYTIGGRYRIVSGDVPLPVPADDMLSTFADGDAASSIIPSLSNFSAESSVPAAPYIPGNRMAFSVSDTVSSRMYIVKT